MTSFGLSRAGLSRTALTMLAIPLALAMLVFSAPSAAADTPQTAAIVVHAPSSNDAQIVGVYRDKQVVAYRWEADRHGEVEGGFVPSAYRDVVRIQIETVDRYAMYDDDGGVRTMFITLDPATLTPAQLSALELPLMSQRVDAFHLVVTHTTQVVRRIDYARSEICDSDATRCDDRIVYEDAPVQFASIAVEA